MEKNKFIGTGVALVTPFDKNNNVDADASEVFGRISNKKWNRLPSSIRNNRRKCDLKSKGKGIGHKATVIEANAGRLPLVLGLGSNHTQALLNEIQHTDLSHFDAILSVSPYYNKPTQRGIYEHYRAVSEAS